MDDPAATGPIGIVGPGRLGQALGKLLSDLGQPVVAIAGRNLSRTSAAAQFIGSARGGNVRAVACSALPALASRILITVPDDALPSVARDLASAPQPVAAALHTCGSRGPEALVFLEAGTGPGRPPKLSKRPPSGAAPGSVVPASFLETCGTSCGTLHPLQTIATREQGVADLPGSFFGITASGESLDWALEICDLLHGHALTIPADRRPLYHAAAVMASNYVVAMIDAAVTLFQHSGVSREEALLALAPLIRASVANSLTSGPAAALTGPIERGDEQTVASHLRALHDMPESLRDLYCSAGLHTVQLARRKSPGTQRGIIESLLRKEQEP